MARKYPLFDKVLQFASTARSRSAVLLAAASFAICHLLAVSTAPAGLNVDSTPEIARQLMHFAAELCRFLLPLGFMIAGLATRASRP
jgi:hypothetical protein